MEASRVKWVDRISLARSFFLCVKSIIIFFFISVAFYLWACLYGCKCNLCDLHHIELKLKTAQRTCKFRSDFYFSHHNCRTTHHSNIGLYITDRTRILPHRYIKFQYIYLRIYFFFLLLTGVSPNSNHSRENFILK